MTHLTDEIFDTAKTYSNSHPDGQPMLEELKQCIADGWSMCMYIDYLSQYFTYNSIQPIIEPIWDMELTGANS
ncbi:hypothetical protein pVco7_gp026 [Vibrio phage pVco-7]|uniref:Uncharacterized protein n=1 Tax=Vibrio phage pVco-5 TaxID=1965485 RepID=A0A1W6JUR0_9CAUD|nr:hypothetical protein KNT61_gp026 [Vibrio phage pVco-5]ARM71014.1 hypothetical protein pVco5_026 [Vibrio phage pVco-5]